MTRKRFGIHGGALLCTGADAADPLLQDCHCPTGGSPAARPAGFAGLAIQSA